MKTDVIIVLGAAVKADGLPGRTLERRVRHAIKLFQEGAAPYLLMTGGIGQHPPAESEVMKRLAVTSGVPETAILLDSDGRSTWDSAEKCTAIMRKHGWNSALIVTDTYHIFRSVLTFRYFGIKAAGSGVEYRLDYLPWWQYLFYIFREFCALCWYFFLRILSS